MIAAMRPGGSWAPSKVPACDLKKTPSANFVVEYHGKLTDKKIVGKVSYELSTRTYGTTEWWVPVEKEEPGQSAASGRGRGRGRGRS